MIMPVFILDKHNQTSHETSPVENTSLVWKRQMPPSNLGKWVKKMESWNCLASFLSMYLNFAVTMRHVSGMHNISTGEMKRTLFLHEVITIELVSY